MKLTIVIEVGEVNPSLVDPYQIYEDIFDAYDEAVDPSARYTFSFVSAEWDGNDV